MPLSEGQAWGVPTLDCFAGGEQGQRQVPALYSKYYCPHAVADRAMYQPWTQHASIGADGPLLWVFPPFELIPVVTHKFMLEQLMQFWCCLDSTSFWQPMLQSALCKP